MKPGSYERTPEIRQKMKKAGLRFYQKLDKENIPYPRLGLRCSYQTRKKLSQIMFHRLEKLKKEGKPHFLKDRKISEETKRKMSLAKKGKHIGVKNPAWKGGRKKSGGYIFIWSPKHPYAGKSGYVKENRLVVEKHIGRFLKPEEACHHINKIKNDNRPENLMAFKSDRAHQLFEKGNKPIPKSDIIFDGRKL